MINSGIIDKSVGKPNDTNQLYMRKSFLFFFFNLHNKATLRNKNYDYVCHYIHILLCREKNIELCMITEKKWT